MTRIHKIRSIQEFQSLCRHLHLRVTDWVNTPEGLQTHAFEQGQCVRHLIPSF